MDILKIKLAKTYGHVYGDTVGTPTGRIVWPALLTPKPGMVDPKTGKEGPPKYEVNLLLKKDDKNTKKFVAMLNEYVGEMVKVFNKAAKARGVKITIEQALRDGDDVDLYKPDKGAYYAGHWVLRARHGEQPIICNTERDGDSWKEIDPKAIQGGMLCRLVVSPMITSGGQLTFLLTYVQLVKDDGTRFGGGFDKKSYGGLLSGDDFDDEEVAECSGKLSEEDDEDDEEDEVESLSADDEDDDEEDDDDEDDEEEEKPKKRAKAATAAAPTRRGKSALINRL